MAPVYWLGDVAADANVDWGQCAYCKGHAYLDYSSICDACRDTPEDVNRCRECGKPCTGEVHEWCAGFAAHIARGGTLD